MHRVVLAVHNGCLLFFLIDLLGFDVLLLDTTILLLILFSVVIILLLHYFADDVDGILQLLLFC